MYEISYHAKRRYAERMKSKKIGIQTFIDNHNDDIKMWINKLIDYGNVVSDVNDKRYYQKDNWLVVVNPTKKVVITLFYMNDFKSDRVLNYIIGRDSAGA